MRTAIEALAAVLGGTQSLHTNSMDEALALPTENAVKIALRTQQMIADETGVANTIDPLGGSYFVEELTNRLEAEAYEYFDRIDELGGVVPAIKENFFQREIAEASYRYQQEVDARPADHRRRQRLRGSDEQRHPDPAHRPARSSASRPSACAPCARGGDSAAVEAALAPPGARPRRRRRQPHAAAARRRARLRDDGRDLRRPARRLGRLARDACVLGLLGDLPVPADPLHWSAARTGGGAAGGRRLCSDSRFAALNGVLTERAACPSNLVA